MGNPMSLFDSHVLLWSLAFPERLGKRLWAKIDAQSSFLFSPLSIFELQLVAMKGKLPPLPESLSKLALEAGMTELPFDARAAEDAQHLRQLLGTDPFDWMLVSQAQSAGCDFYTADLRLLGLGLPFIKDATL